MINVNSLAAARISRDTPMKVDDRPKKLEVVNPERVEQILGLNPTFPPKSEENSRMQTRLGGPRPF